MCAGLIAEPGFCFGSDHSARTTNGIRGEKMATILIPTPLRRLTGGQSKVQIPGENVADLIQGLEAEYPGMAERILDGNGNAKRFIQIFRNEDEIRTLQGLETPVATEDRISIVPAMAGGR
jgi:molybdopterin synthase sulfur carrier subunit